MANIVIVIYLKCNSVCIIGGFEYMFMQKAICNRGFRVFFNFFYLRKTNFIYMLQLILQFLNTIVSIHNTGILRYASQELLNITTKVWRSLDLYNVQLLIC